MSKGLQAKVAFIGDAKGLLKTTKSIDRNLKGLAGKFQSLGKIAKIALGGFAITKVVGFLKQSVRAADEASKAQKRLDAVFAASGAKSLGLFKELNSQATDISLKFGIDDDDVKVVQTKLGLYIAAFADQGKEGADKFKTATKLAFDIDAAGLTSAEEAAKTIGRILLEPLDAAARLKKLGITLTTEQIASIKELVAQGKIAEAQDVILQAIAKSVGGAAEANATALTRLNTAVGEIVESIGVLFLPLLEPLATALSTVAEKTSEYEFNSSALGKTYNEKVVPYIKDAWEEVKNWAKEVGLARPITEAFDDTLEALGKETDTTKGKTDLLKLSQDNLKGAFKNILDIGGEILRFFGVDGVNVLDKFLGKTITVSKSDTFKIWLAGFTAGLEDMAAAAEFAVKQLALLVKAAPSVLTLNFTALNNIAKEMSENSKNFLKGLISNKTLSPPVPNFPIYTGNPNLQTKPKVTEPTPTITVPNLNDFGTGTKKNDNDGKTIIKELPTGKSAAELEKERLEALAKQDAQINAKIEGLTLAAQKQAEAAELQKEASLAQILFTEKVLNRRTGEDEFNQPTITVNVQTLVPTAQTGKVIVDAINQYTSRSGKFQLVDA